MFVIILDRDTTITIDHLADHTNKKIIRQSKVSKEESLFRAIKQRDIRKKIVVECS